jgi:hypothetical protein
VASNSPVCRGSLAVLCVWGIWSFTVAIVLARQNVFRALDLRAVFGRCGPQARRRDTVIFERNTQANLATALQYEAIYSCSAISVYELSTLSGFKAKGTILGRLGAGNMNSRTSSASFRKRTTPNRKRLKAPYDNCSNLFSTPENRFAIISDNTKIRIAEMGARSFILSTAALQERYGQIGPRIGCLIWTQYTGTARLRYHPRTNRATGTRHFYTM